MMGARSACPGPPGIDHLFRTALMSGLVLLMAGCTGWELDLSELGDDRPPVPFMAVSAGYATTCALIRNGRLVCWGATGAGQVGSGEDPRDMPGPGSFPVDVSDRESPSFADISVGETHACALTEEGVAYCWGSNRNGKLGTTSAPDDCGSGEANCAWRPIPVDTDHRFVDISAGRAHTCAVAEDGLAYCWGSNRAGQLAREGSETHPLPGPPVADIRFQTISAGDLHACGLSRSNVPYCWGGNVYEQADPFGDEQIREPARPAGLASARSVATGVTHSCAILRDGDIRCWGEMMSHANQGPTFGYGSYSTYKEDPTGESEVRPGPPPPMVEVYSGGRHACALDAGGGAWCWGANSNGQLGASYGTSPILVPQRISEYRFSTLSAGEEHTCGITLDTAEVYCWGSNWSRRSAGGGYSPSVVPYPGN